MSPAERQSGFTLVELLCAVTIALVLLTVALPGWREYRQGVERVQAVRGLQQAAGCQAARTAVNLAASLADCLPASTRSYRFLLVPARGGFDRGHEWRAEPRGPQRGDACGTLVLDHSGSRRLLAAPGTGIDCWRGR